MGTNMSLHVEAIAFDRWVNRTSESGAMYTPEYWGPSIRDYDVYARLDGMRGGDIRGTLVPDDRVRTFPGDMLGWLDAEARESGRSDKGFRLAMLAEDGPAQWATVAELRAADWTYDDGSGPIDLSDREFVRWLMSDPRLEAVCVAAGGPERVRLLWWWT